MKRKLDTLQKAKLLLPAAGLGILLCWFFAFNKTIKAIQLHQELTSQTDGAADLSFNPVHTERKLHALKHILKSYKVNEPEWSNDLWMKASAAAVKMNVSIDYVKTKPVLETDSLEVGIRETLYFYGDYLQIVRLIDTLEQIPQIGKIAALQIKAPKPDLTGERAMQCMLKIEFRGITAL